MTETTRAEQLAWEARAGLPAGIAAAVAAICLIGGSLYLQASVGERADDTAELLRLVDEHGRDFIVAGVIQAVGLLALVPALGYLYRATRFRRPQTPRLAMAFLLSGPILAAALGIVRQAEFVSVAGDFVAGLGGSGSPDDRADRLIDDSALPAVSGVGLAANIAIGVGIILLALNAMRAGLTSRFYGAIGIIIGVLYVLPVVGGPQIVQVFWLGGLACLFIGKWPNGRGPAWGSGEAIPWPTAAEIAERREDERQALQGGSPNGRGNADGDAGAGRPRKRKRKRR